MKTEFKIRTTEDPNVQEKFLSLEPSPTGGVTVRDEQGYYYVTITEKGLHIPGYAEEMGVMIDDPGTGAPVIISDW